MMALYRYLNKKDCVNLKNISNRIKGNQLKLNIQQTKFMILCVKLKFRTQIVDKLKLLRVVIDEYFYYNTHTY